MVGEIEQVLERAAALVTPSSKEIRKLEAICEIITSKINATLDKEKSSTRPQLILGGSYARGTWLKGSHDLDFFLLYPVDLPRDKLETTAIRSASEAMSGFPINLRYAEHPYVESFVDGVRVNVVPCYDVAPGEWQSAADRSPYHTKYILSKLDDNLRLQVRLLKKFTKSIEVYGAEVKIQGFSGYVCEVLTIKYGSFVGALEEFTKLKPGQVISTEPFDEDLAETFKSTIVILDPVDTTRNLGSAISARNVGKLALEAKRFLTKTSLTFFLPRKIDHLPRGSLLSSMIVVSFRNEPRSPDILWGELKRSMSSISEKLEALGFNVLRSSSASNEKDESAFVFLLSSLDLERNYVRVGPEYFRTEEVQKYYEKNRKRALLTWVGNDGRMESVFERDKDMTHAQAALKFILGKQRIDSVGISPRVKSELLQGFKISGADRLSQAKTTPDWLLKPISELATND